MDEPILLPGMTLLGRYVVRTILAVGPGWSIALCELPLGGGFKKYLGYFVLEAGEEGMRRAHARFSDLSSRAKGDPRLAPLDFGVAPSGHPFLLNDYKEGVDFRVLLPSPAPVPVAGGTAGHFWPGDLVSGQYTIRRVLDQDELGVYYAASVEALGIRARLYVLHEHLASSAEHAQRVVDIARERSLRPVPGGAVRDIGRLEDGRPFLVLEA